MEPMLFGQLLLNLDLVSETDLRRCLLIQSQCGFTRPLGEILIEEELIDERTLATILAVQRSDLSGNLGKGVPQHEIAQRIADGRAASFLALTRDLGASDLYLTAGKIPMVRLNGILTELPAERLDREACAATIAPLMRPEHQAEFERQRELDFCTTIPDSGRFRVNIFEHREGLGAVIRVLTNEARSIDDLGLPGIVHTFTRHRNGLVLITGATGCGKTTTLGALIHEINTTQERHVVMLEDPIEIIFSSDRSLITQREIGTHTASFADGLRSALREDPDVIVVGEIRDPETFAVALTAAETGHLVFGTLHTRSAHGTILRVVDQFPSPQRPHMRSMLAGALRAVLCQELLPTVDGEDRVLATELMVNNQAISSLIRENRPWQIPNIMQVNATAGMHTLDQSLDHLVRAGRVTVEDAIDRAHDRNRFLVRA